MTSDVDTDFPCTLQLDVPLPTTRLAAIAVKALSVDKELSPLVRRRFVTLAAGTVGDNEDDTTQEQNILRVHYEATTNRMLRVAVNSFMDSLLLIIEVMEKLDADVLEAQNKE